MKQHRTFTALTLLFILVTGLMSNAGVAGTLYTHATLIDPETKAVTPNVYIHVENGRFRYVGVERPTNTSNINTIDLEHQFVTPGFIDTHAHIGLGAVSFEVENNEFKMIADNSMSIAQWNAQQLLNHGVTTIRNPGGDTRANLAYRQAQHEAQIIGPRAFVAGSILNNLPFEGLAVNVDTRVSIEQAIDFQADRGVDYIKLYTGLSEEQISIAVSEAQKHDLSVIGHLEAVSWTTGSELGVNNLVHAMPISPQLLPESIRSDYSESTRGGAFSFFEWYEVAQFDTDEVDQLLNTLRRNNTSVDPTLIVFYNAFYGDDPAVTEHSKMSLSHPSLIENWTQLYHFNLGWTENDFERAQRVWPQVLAFVKLLHDSGVTLTVGTDLGNPWVIPGYSYFQEMQLLQDAGITPIDILQMATLNAATTMEQEHQLGRIEEGYIADFNVFSENPVVDLQHLESINLVVQDGKHVYSDEMLE